MPRTHQPGLYVGAFLMAAMLIGDCPALASLNEVPLPPTEIAGVLRSGQGSDSEIKQARIAGVVTWVNQAGNMFVLQDNSGAAMFEAPHALPEIQFGHRVTLEGRITVSGDRIVFVSQPLVEGRFAKGQPPSEASGSVHLEPGRHPVRFEFLLTSAQTAPLLTFSGPAIPLKTLQAADLEYQNAEGNWVPGMQFRCFRGTWEKFHGFGELLPIASGNTTNFDAPDHVKKYNLGLEFSGSIVVPTAGTYEFRIRPGNHARLFVNEERVRILSAEPAGLPAPIAIRPGQPVPTGQNYLWGEVAGTVTAIGRHDGQARIDLNSDGGRMEVHVGRTEGLDGDLLLRNQVRIAGVVQSQLDPAGKMISADLLVQDPSLIRLDRLRLQSWNRIPEVHIGELKETSEPAPGNLVRLRGRVRKDDPRGGMALEDSTGRIGVRFRSAEVPKTGAVVEVIGKPVLSPEGWTIPDPLWRQTDQAFSTRMSSNLPVTTIERIRLMSPEKLVQHVAVRLRGVVTCNRENGVATIQDETGGIGCWFSLPQGETLQPGDYIEVFGVANEGKFGPTIRQGWASRQGKAKLPEPLRPAWEQLTNGSLDQQWVEVQGVVRQIEGNDLTIKTRDGQIVATMIQGTPAELARLQDAIVCVRGVVAPFYDGRGEIQKVGLWVSSPAFVTTEVPAVDPSSVPLKRVPDLLRFDPQRADSFYRVKVRGQVIHVGREDGYLFDDSRGLRFFPQKQSEFRLGDQVELFGFPELGGYAPILRDAKVERLSSGELPPARRLGAAELLSGAHDAELVAVEGIVVKQSIYQSDHLLEFEAGGRIFSARLDSQLGPLPPVPPGSRVQLTGVCVNGPGGAQAGTRVDSFELLLNSPSDVAILERAPWWTVGRVMALAGILAGVLLLAAVWIHLLRRRVEERTADLEKAIQQRERAERHRASEAERSRIARDLHDDLGSSLTGISLLASVGRPPASQTDSRTTARLDAIADKARSLVTALDTIVWAVDPEADGLQTFSDYLSGYAQEFLTDSGLLSRFKIPMEFPPRRVSGNLRHGLMLAVKEALNNAVRHAQASEVEFGIHLVGDRLEIEIADNGTGFDPAATGDGHGLTNMQKRLAEAGGECQILSQPGSGTSVRMTVPLPATPA